MVEQKTVNRNTAKKILVMLVEQDIDPLEYVTKNNLVMISDTGSIAEVVDSVLSINKKVVDDYLNGNEKVFGFLVGQVMKNLGGKADPAAVNKILKERLSV